MQVITARAINIAYGTGSHTFHFSPLPQDVPPLFETNHSAATQLNHAIDTGALVIWAPQDAPVVPEAATTQVSDRQSDQSDATQSVYDRKATPKGKGR